MSSSDNSSSAPHDSDSDGPAPAARKSSSINVTGFLHTDGQLYLRDNKTNAIYQSDRDARGELIPLGKHTASGPVFDRDHGAAASSAPDPGQQEGQQEPDATEKPLSKRRQRELALAQVVVRTLPASLNFQVTDAADHCETGIKAYRDLQPVLEVLAQVLGRGPAQLQVYDPYFCTGRVKEHLAKIGFPNVYNENEDFYARLAGASKQALPEHDVLVTNPPYSADHVERILAHCAASSQPTLLLLPAYVSFKPYYAAYLKAAKPFYLVPRSSRYTYNSPAGTPSGAKRTAPFNSFWYLDMKQHRGAVLERLSRARAVLVHQGRKDEEGGQVCANLEAIPVKCLDESDPRRKLAREQERKAMRGGRGFARGRGGPKRGMARGRGRFLGRGGGLARGGAAPKRARTAAEQHGE
jgi:hypothetical protein